MWKIPVVVALFGLCFQQVRGLSVLPNTGCGPVCKIGCLYGNVLDERGCPTCQCKPAPATLPATVGQRYPPYCGPVCRIGCPYGNVLDSRGCPLCRCKPAPGYPPRPRCGPVCAIFCPYGNVVDARGCPTCRCRPEPKQCPPRLCGCGPPYVTRYTQGSDGCPVCSCEVADIPTPQSAQQGCPPITCPQCYEGSVVKLGADGCSRCECRSAPRPPVNPGDVIQSQQSQTWPQLPPDFNRCPQIQCPICPGGFKYTTDEKGCNYCSCKDDPLAGPTPPPDVNRCPQVQCPICPNGYDYTTDANGCNFCSCKPPLNAATPLPPDFNRCPQIQCPICPGGFKYTTDEKGCNYCSCKDTLTAPVQVGLPDLGRRCPQAACPVCPAGFDYPLDSNGCGVCVCKTAPAVPVPPTPNQGPQCGPVCLIFCPYGNVMDARGCPTCTCRPRPPPRCLQPRETGRCRAAFPSFYYDTRSNRCQNFIYGGCGGNQNRFSSLQECQAVCERNQDSGNPRVLCPDIRATCRRYCWLGFEKDANGCETCQCRNLFPGFSGFF